MILSDFSSFRARFATRAARSGPLMTFTAPDTMVLAAESWLAPAPSFKAGMRLFVTKSALNSGSYIVDTVNATTITTVEQTVVNEAAVNPDFEAQFYGTDGLPVWPVEYMRVGDTGITFADLAFNYLGYGGIRLGSKAYDGSTIVISSTTGADSVYDADERDWYVSQRTDLQADQYLDITQEPFTMANTYSRMLRITPTPLAESRFGFSTAAGEPLSPTTVRALFNRVHVYVRRIQDQAIQVVDMLKAIDGLV